MDGERKRPRRPGFRQAGRGTLSWRETPMAEVTMYTKTYCPFCLRAKALMQSKGVAFEEVNLDEHPERRGEMIARAEGRHTVPQIFIAGQAVGGCDDVFELEERGELDGLLGRTA
jgi:glutaredoxin 3